MKASYLVILVSVAFVAAGMVSLGGNDDALSQEMALLEKAVATANKKCLKLEHDAVYTNAVCKVAYSEVKRVEKELHSKRQILVDRLESVPEVHQARAERTKAYARLLSFKKRTGFIRRKEKK
jgi:septal ring factor EnvC (AmiA/AmiB activator)